MENKFGNKKKIKYKIKKVKVIENFKFYLFNYDICPKIMKNKINIYIIYYNN